MKENGCYNNGEEVKSKLTNYINGKRSAISIFEAGTSNENCGNLSGRGGQAVLISITNNK